MRYSVVIPVFNSQTIVGTTIDRTVEYLREQGLDGEIILVNDGSKDDSWSIIKNKAMEYKEVVAINLLRNYGQHVANMCGFQHATGDYLITIDDDLQNPPEEIGKLITAIDDDCDLVIGRFAAKKHSFIRRLGSKLIGYINRQIFSSPKGLVLSNFRLIRRDVIERVCRYNGSYPYIPGLLLMHSTNRKNVLVEHHARTEGSSNYNLLRIAKLVSEILFNYSSYPLRIVACVGLLASLLSFILALYYFINTIIGGTTVPGWATVVILLSFFNGMSLLMLGMLGEYVIRLINQTGQQNHYEIKEAVRG